jgi:signal recognition particle subunit SRP54
MTSVDFNGVVLTKLDGDTRGGCALSIKAVVEKPIKFISLGEKLDSIELFHPERMASEFLEEAMLFHWLKKLRNKLMKSDAKDLEKKLMENKFDFNDFLKQIKMIKKMGSLQSIMGMIPGVGANLKNADIDDKQLVRVEAIIQSMTIVERKNPKVLNGSRQ